jgi:hypothetical protein
MAASLSWTVDGLFLTQKYGVWPWQHMATRGSTWQHMAAHGSTLQHMAAHGNTWQHMATHGSTWQHMGAHGNTWQHMATHGSTWLYMAFLPTHERGGLQDVSSETQPLKFYFYNCFVKKENW